MMPSFDRIIDKKLSNSSKYQVKFKSFLGCFDCAERSGYVTCRRLGGMDIIAFVVCCIYFNVLSKQLEQSCAPVKIGTGIMPATKAAKDIAQ